MKLCIRTDACGNDRERVVRFCKGVGEHLVHGMPELPGMHGPDGLIKPDRLQEYCGYLRSHGVTLQMVTGRMEDAELATDEAARRSTEQICATLSAMKTAGVPSMFLFIGAKAAGSAREREAQWARLRTAYRTIVARAAAEGRQIATHGMQTPEYLLFSAADSEKLITLAPDACNGLTFCVGCFTLAGDDIRAWLERFGTQRIFMIHMRDVQTYAEGRFADVRYGEGKVDLRAFVRKLKDIGYDGLVCPEHVPRFEQDPFEEISTAWGLGYLKALFASEGIRL